MSIYQKAAEAYSEAMGQKFDVAEHGGLRAIVDAAIEECARVAFRCECYEHQQADCEQCTAGLRDALLALKVQP